MFSRLLQWLKRPEKRKGFSKQILTPVLSSRSEHTLSRRLISPQALKVLYRLHDAGFQAYLVGGGVRDVLLGYHPKDFDVATNAHPEEVAHLFRNSRMIGRRFRLVHVHFGHHIVEVATFRASPNESETNSFDPNLARRAADGMILRDNIYGTIEQDVLRRDFTVNALYYNIADYSLVDYVGGLKDLKNRTLRLIGDPEQRYREDPLRMLRAIRFAAKLKFTIDPETETPIYTLAGLIANVPSARVFDEYLKMFMSGCADDTFKLLQKYGLVKILFPLVDALLSLEGNRHPWIGHLIEKSLQNTDQRVKENKAVTPVFLLAVFLWYPIVVKSEYLQSQHNISSFQALHDAIDEVLQQQQKAFAIPRRMTQFLKEIWLFQVRMQTRQKNRIKQLEMHPRFRAAYDFLILRQEAGEPIGALVAWWTEYHHGDDIVRENLLNARCEKKQSRRPKRRRDIKPLD